jgi:hypothetical protein
MRLGAGLVMAIVASVGSARAQDPQRLLREQRQFMLDQQRLGSSCDDLSELRRISKTVLPATAPMYTQTAEQRRKAQLLNLASSTQAFSAKVNEWTPEFFASSETGDGTLRPQRRGRVNAVIREQSTSHKRTRGWSGRGAGAVAMRRTRDVSLRELR